MATARPFAYNTGSQIAGTEQIGNLAIGEPSSGFEETGLKWWNGPDEDLGYVIAHQTPAGQSGADGTTAYLGFLRTTAMTDGSFISLAESVSVSHGNPQTFSSASEAKTWLNNNGYWTSYNGGGGGVTTGSYTLLNAYSPANANGSITFPNSSDVASNDPNIVGLNPGNGIYINKFDLLGNDQSSVLDLLIGRSGTLTLTQGSNSVTYSFTSTAFNFTSTSPYANQYWWDNYHNGAQSPLGTITVTSEAGEDFNYVDPITITVT